MQKGYFLPIVGIILVLIVGIGFYIKANKGNIKIETPAEVSSPQPSDDLTQADYTKDWNEYLDEKFKFSFKYPKDWNFSKASLEGIHPKNKTLLQINLLNPSYDKNKLLNFDPSKPSENPSDPDKDPYSITVRVWDNTEKQSLKEKLLEIDKFFQNFQYGYSPLLPAEDAKEHIRIAKNASGITVSENIFLRDNYLIIISGAPMESRALYKFTQIMDTFKLMQ